MHIAVWMLSCPEREAVRAGTLGRWAGTDWGAGVAPRVFIDPGAPDGFAWGDARRFARMSAAYAGMLAAAAEADARADWLLLLEDDLDFHPRLRAALAAWPAFSSL